jgi:hypothetical protein
MVTILFCRAGESHPESGMVLPWITYVDEITSDTDEDTKVL